MANPSDARYGVGRAPGDPGTDNTYEGNIGGGGYYGDVVGGRRIRTRFNPTSGASEYDMRALGNGMYEVNFEDGSRGVLTAQQIRDEFAGGGGGAGGGGAGGGGGGYGGGLGIGDYRSGVLGLRQDEFNYRMQSNQIAQELAKNRLEIEKAQQAWKEATDRRDFEAAQYWRQRSDYWTGRQHDLSQQQLEVGKGNTLLNLGSRPETLLRYLYARHGMQVPQGLDTAAPLPGYGPSPTGDQGQGGGGQTQLPTGYFQGGGGAGPSAQPAPGPTTVATQGGGTAPWYGPNQPTGPIKVVYDSEGFPSTDPRFGRSNAIVGTGAPPPGYGEANREAQITAREPTSYENTGAGTKESPLRSTPKYGKGGDVTLQEPTALVGLRTRRVRALAGEAGPERVHFGGDALIDNEPQGGLPPVPGGGSQNGGGGPVDINQLLGFGPGEGFFDVGGGNQGPSDVFQTQGGGGPMQMMPRGGGWNRGQGAMGDFTGQDLLGGGGPADQARGYIARHNQTGLGGGPTEREQGGGLGYQRGFTGMGGALGSTPGNLGGLGGMVGGLRGGGPLGALPPEEGPWGMGPFGPNPQPRGYAVPQPFGSMDQPLQTQQLQPSGFDVGQMNPIGGQMPGQWGGAPGRLLPPLPPMGGDMGSPQIAGAAGTGMGGDFMGPAANLFNPSSLQSAVSIGKGPGGIGILPQLGQFTGGGRSLLPSPQMLRRGSPTDRAAFSGILQDMFGLAPGDVFDLVSQLYRPQQRTASSRYR